MKLDIKTLFDVVITMLVPVIAGFVATKAKILTDDYPKKLSNLVLYVCQPFLLASAVLGTEYSKENVKAGLTVLLIGFLVHGLAAVIAFVSTAPFKDKGLGRIMEHCILFGNVGFFGIPVIRATFGEIGVFYTGFFIITFNIVLWSYGSFVLSRASKDIKLKLTKILFNAGTIPCTIGLILYFCRIPIYPPIVSSMKTIGASCTPLSMIIVGALLARMPVKRLITDWQMYFATFMKLAVVPLATAIVLKLLGFSEYFSIFGALMMALPSASSSAMFAQKYDLHPELAAETVGVSTVISVATIPLIMQLIKIIV